MTERRFDYWTEVYNTMQIATVLCAYAGRRPSWLTRVKMELLSMWISAEASRKGYKIRWMANYYISKSGAPGKAYYVVRPMRLVDLG